MFRIGCSRYAGCSEQYEPVHYSGGHAKAEDCMKMLRSVGFAHGLALQTENWAMTDTTPEAD